MCIINKEQIVHDLAITYAKSKLNEYVLDRREAPLAGNTSMSNDEIQYLKRAYDFAIQNLSD